MEQDELAAALRGLMYEKPCVPAVSRETLAAIRDAAEAAPPVEVSWAPEVRDALRWPALAAFVRETPEDARRREFHERILREAVASLPLLTPHPSVGNVVPVRPARRDTGQADRDTEA